MYGAENLQAQENFFFFQQFFVGALALTIFIVAIVYLVHRIRLENANEKVEKETKPQETPMETPIANANAEAKIVTSDYLKSLNAQIAAKKVEETKPDNVVVVEPTVAAATMVDEAKEQAKVFGDTINIVSAENIQAVKENKSKKGTKKAKTGTDDTPIDVSSLD